MDNLFSDLTKSSIKAEQCKQKLQEKNLSKEWSCANDAIAIHLSIDDIKQSGFIQFSIDCNKIEITLSEPLRKALENKGDDDVKKIIEELTQTIAAADKIAKSKQQNLQFSFTSNGDIFEKDIRQLLNDKSENGLTTIEKISNITGKMLSGYELLNKKVEKQFETLDKYSQNKLNQMNDELEKYKHTNNIDTSSLKEQSANVANDYNITKENITNTKEKIQKTSQDIDGNISYNLNNDNLKEKIPKKSLEDRRSKLSKMLSEILSNLKMPEKDLEEAIKQFLQNNKPKNIFEVIFNIENAIVKIASENPHDIKEDEIAKYFGNNHESIKKILSLEEVIKRIAKFPKEDAEKIKKFIEDRKNQRESDFQKTKEEFSKSLTKLKEEMKGVTLWENINKLEMDAIENIFDENHRNEIKNIARQYKDEVIKYIEEIDGNFPSQESSSKELLLLKIQIMEITKKKIDDIPEDIVQGWEQEQQLIQEKLKQLEGLKSKNSQELINEEKTKLADELKIIENDLQQAKKLQKIVETFTTNIASCKEDKYFRKQYYSSIEQLLENKHQQLTPYYADKMREAMFAKSNSMPLLKLCKLYDPQETRSQNTKGIFANAKKKILGDSPQGLFRHSVAISNMIDTMMTCDKIEASKTKPHYIAKLENLFFENMRAKGYHIADEQNSLHNLATQLLKELENKNSKTTKILAKINVDKKDLQNACQKVAKNDIGKKRNPIETDLGECNFIKTNTYLEGFGTFKKITKKNVFTEFAKGSPIEFSTAHHKLLDEQCAISDEIFFQGFKQQLIFKTTPSSEPKTWTIKIGENEWDIDDKIFNDNPQLKVPFENVIPLRKKGNPGSSGKETSLLVISSPYPKAVFHYKIHGDILKEIDSGKEDNSKDLSGTFYLLRKYLEKNSVTPQEKFDIISDIYDFSYKKDLSDMEKESLGIWQDEKPKCIQDLCQSDEVKFLNIFHILKNDDSKSIDHSLFPSEDFKLSSNLPMTVKNKHKKFQNAYKDYYDKVGLQKAFTENEKALANKEKSTKKSKKPTEESQLQSLINACKEEISSQNVTIQDKFQNPIESSLQDGFLKNDFNITQAESNADTTDLENLNDKLQNFLQTVSSENVKSRTEEVIKNYSELITEMRKKHLHFQNCKVDENTDVLSISPSLELSIHKLQSFVKNLLLQKEEKFEELQQFVKANEDIASVDELIKLFADGKVPTGEENIEKTIAEFMIIDVDLDKYSQSLYEIIKLKDLHSSLIKNCDIKSLQQDTISWDKQKVEKWNRAMSSAIKNMPFMSSIKEKTSAAEIAFQYIEEKKLRPDQHKYLTKIFDTNDSFIFVNAGTGFGKSTIIKAIANEFVKKESEKNPEDRNLVTFMTTKNVQDDLNAQMRSFAFNSGKQNIVNAPFLSWDPDIKLWKQNTEQLLKQIQNSKGKTSFGCSMEDRFAMEKILDNLDKNDHEHSELISNLVNIRYELNRSKCIIDEWDYLYNCNQEYLQEICKKVQDTVKKVCDKDDTTISPQSLIQDFSSFISGLPSKVMMSATTGTDFIAMNAAEITDESQLNEKLNTDTLTTNARILHWISNSEKKVLNTIDANSFTKLANEESKENPRSSFILIDSGNRFKTTPEDTAKAIFQTRKKFFENQSKTTNDQGLWKKKEENLQVGFYKINAAGEKRLHVVRNNKGKREIVQLSEEQIRALRAGDNSENTCYFLTSNEKVGVDVPQTINHAGYTTGISFLADLGQSMGRAGRNRAEGCKRIMLFDSSDGIKQSQNLEADVMKKIAEKENDHQKDVCNKHFVNGMISSVINMRIQEWEKIANDIKVENKEAVNEAIKKIKNAIPEIQAPHNAQNLTETIKNQIKNVDDIFTKAITLVDDNSQKIHHENLEKIQQGVEKLTFTSTDKEQLTKILDEITQKKKSKSNQAKTINSIDSATLENINSYIEKKQDDTTAIGNNIQHLQELYEFVLNKNWQGIEGKLIPQRSVKTVSPKEDDKQQVNSFLEEYLNQLNKPDALSMQDHLTKKAKQEGKKTTELSILAWLHEKKKFWELLLQTKNNLLKAEPIKKNDVYDEVSPIYKKVNLIENAISKMPKA